MMGLEFATRRLQTECSSHWAIQLKSYFWRGVEFIQFVYCIIIILSFLKCDWLFIREEQWFYWTLELLVPVEKFSVKMPMMRPELVTPRLQSECSSQWAIQLKNHCWEGVEFIELVYCVIMISSFLKCDWLLMHQRSTAVLLDTGTPGTSREIFNEDADVGTRTRNPSPLWNNSPEITVGLPHLLVNMVTDVSDWVF